jgi:DNA-nicking Smr family endonuclease
VLKIICGAGTHSKEGLAILKYKIPEWLSEEKKFDIYVIESEGIILVRFEVVKLPL